VHFTVDGVIVARGEGHLQWVTSEVFTRLRGPGGARSDELVEPPAPASLFAELVGRRDQTQILVEPDEPRTGRLRLRLDPTHTTYFDHPQDHLPANLAAEAVRQAALLHHPEGQVLGVRLAFHRFADLDRPILLTSVVEQGRVQVELRQECTVAASGSVALGAHEGLLEVPAGRHH
jgi:hypothetical protein